MIKLIKEFKDYTFVIPDYQRSYRWTEQEVTDLLNDLDEFGEANKKDSQYCLQPLIVKQMDGVNKFEVVDGQQRLTTIFLINEVRINIDKSKSKIYSIEYDNRQETEAVLNNFHTKKEANQVDDIDQYHMANAYNTIHSWLKKSGDAKGKIEKIINILLEKTFFIFYSIPENQSPEDTYSKINNGKIRLTNAELIKSLLMKTEFTTDASIFQKGISLKWEQIEQELHDDNFWYFLHNDQYMEPRIDLLFEMLANKYLKDYKNKLQVNVKDDRWVFFTISDVIKQRLIEIDENVDYSQAVIDKVWRDLVSIYSRLKSWYIDQDKYHIIGYILATNIKDINSVLNESYKFKKDKFREKLINEIKTSLQWDTYDIRELTYDKATDKNKIKKILLLFNIIQYIKTNPKAQENAKSEANEKNTRFDGQKFSFKCYKKGRWDLEHINPTAGPNSDPLFHNITLLNASINRSYQDATFVVKREEIIRNDKIGEFIPVCTKNVFLKYYTTGTNIIDFSSWDETDKSQYIQTIEDDVKKFLSEKKDDDK